MKIAEVDSVLVAGAHFVRVRTEDGTTGLGQSANFAYPGAVDAIAKSFERYLVGQDARQIERHWHHLYRMGPFRGSALSGAISAVDIALWDLKGRLVQAPVWELLGGRYRERIRLHLLLKGETPDEIAVAAVAAVAEGFTAIKFDPLPKGYQDMGLAALCDAAKERAAAARGAVGGDVDLILELARKLTPLQFPTVARAIREFRPLFVEDPIQIDSIRTQGDMARQVDVPLGNGERLNTIWEFRELLEAGGAQFVRPDPGLSGGISQCKKIATVAEAHHAVFCPHNFLGPLLTSVCVHLDTSIPNFVVQEYSKAADEGPFAEAFSGSLRRSGGYLPIPEAPGLGIDLDESKLVDLLAESGWDLVDTPLRADGSVGTVA